MRGQNSLQSEEQIRFWCPNQGGRGGFLLEKAPAGNVAEQGREAMSKGDGGPWGQGSPTHSESPNNCSSSLDSVLSRTWTHWIQLTLWFNPTASERVGIKKKKKKLWSEAPEKSFFMATESSWIFLELDSSPFGFAPRILLLTSWPLNPSDPFCSSMTVIIQKLAFSPSPDASCSGERRCI